MVKDMKNKKPLVKKLCILWIVTFVLAGIISNGYVICTLIHTGTRPTMLSIHQIAVLASSLFYFSPLLFIIQYHAKRAEMKKTTIIAKVGFVFFSLWNTLALTLTIFAYLKG